MKGKKSSEGYNKITMFPGVHVNLEDAVIDDAMDEALRESIKREADELEARLNSNPAMKGIGASDDLFDKVVASLKEMGVWEEEEEEEALKDKGVPEGEKRTFEAGEEQKAVRMSVEDNAGKKEQEEDFGPKSGSEKAGDSEIEIKETAEAEELNAEDANKVQQISRKENSDLSKNMESESAGSGTEAELNSNSADSDSAKLSAEIEDNQMREAIHKFLSQDDREAMELGHRIRRENEEKRRRRKKRTKVLRRVGVVAASVVVVFSASMTSGANRRLFLRVWDATMENLGVRTAVNFVDIEKYVESRDKEEYNAAQDIREKLGVSPIYFRYLPDKMKFLRYEIQINWGQAVLFYSNNDTIMTVQIIKNNEDRASYIQLDEASDETEFLENDQEIKVKLQKAGDEKEKAYMFQFERNECRYIISGAVSYEEMKKIIKYLFVFEE